MFLMYFIYSIIANMFQAILLLIKDYKGTNVVL